MKILDQCIEIAKKHNPHHAQINGYRHYSFVVQSDKLVEWATNSDGPALPGYKDYQKRHSESNAYFKARGLLDKKKSFYVVNIRLSKDGRRIKNSKPCECCKRWLLKLGCKQVFFTVTSFGFAKINI